MVNSQIWEYFGNKPRLIHSMIRALFPLLASCLLVSCTHLGAPDPVARQKIDFGPEETLQLCVLLDEPTITPTKAQPLIDSISQELAAYGIRVEVPWMRSWHRPSGGGMAIIETLASERLAPPCDRILALVGRNFGDFLMGFLAVDEMGSVDTVTSTRGYIAANVGTLNQVFVPPKETAIHEAYHLLGCQHGLSMAACYERIRQLKIAATINHANGNDFFPTYSRRGQLLLTRESVDVREAMALKVEQAKRR